MIASSSAPSRLPSTLFWLAILIYVVVVTRCAWMSDDAYVTLRTVDNIVNGHGAIWNPGERVQAYTHPLWMLLLLPIYAVTHEAFVTSMVTGIVIATLAVARATRGLAGVSGPAIFGIALLTMSRTVVDYTTSGLENPLSHLLVALLYTTYLRNADRRSSDWRIYGYCALLMVNRLDLALIGMPIALDTLRRRGLSGSIRPLALGFAPLVVWELFSLIYYGSLVPNTAIAKLDNGVSAVQLWGQGLLYYIYQLRFDPLSLASIAAALTVTISLRRTNPRAAVAAIGVVLYGIYVAKIGGDFMAGRFFSVLVFASACLLVDALHRAEATRSVWTEVGAGLGVVVALGMLAETPAPQIGVMDAQIQESGIVDERRFWGLGHHLLGLRTHGRPPYHGVTVDGRTVRKGDENVVVRQAVGAFGYHVGPEVYVVDRYALGDPFLARLPVAKLPGPPRPGHHARIAPPGYVISLKAGEAKLVDPDLEELWRMTRSVHSGPLFTLQRWRDIWALNTGRARALVDRTRNEAPYLNEVPHWVLTDRLPPGFGWDQPGIVLVEPKKGLKVMLESVSHAPEIWVSADHNDQYTLKFFRGSKAVGKTKVSKSRDPAAFFMQERVVTVPNEVQKAGYDALLFAPTRKADKGHSLGHVILQETPPSSKTKRPKKKPGLSLQGAAKKK